MIVQKPETAQFDGMPNSAEKTGIVDAVLAPEEMPDALLRHASRRARGDAEQPPEAAEPDQESGMRALFRILRKGYGIDFSHYRPATVERRTERRLQISGANSLADYARRLEEDPEEVNALYKDLLIGVTRFLRDREAFASLASVIPPAPTGSGEAGGVSRLGGRVRHRGRGLLGGHPYPREP